MKTNLKNQYTSRAALFLSYLTHVRAFDRHFVGIPFGEDMRSRVAFAETDFIRFSFSTDDLIKRIHIWIEDISYFDSHWNITNEKTLQRLQLIF